ncbi:MAG: SDR family NAD(P)-dependent oxidoreductase [Acidimicrobiia bacterium]|nr:MAG: SDR family NAD(P)-dependent oxidoreductase [Acidimicrobiia bacterium]
MLDGEGLEGDSPTRVLVTGGTGFVGSHTVAALVKQGHWVRLLARSHDRVGPALAPHEVEASDVVIGNVTDQSAVEKAMAGCEALIHAANVFSFDPRQTETMSTVNAQGTELVLAEASRVGLDPIVHVSTLAVFLPSDQPLTRDSEVGKPAPAYSKSKAVAEHIARRFQADGVPVVTTYPGSVWGPHDPYLGESNRLAQNILRGKFHLVNEGPLPIGDVRDVAAVHAAVLQPGRGPRRYVVAGHSPGFRALTTQLGKLTGRNLWSIPVPAPMALAVGRAADWARSRFGADLALSYEAPWVLAHSNKADSTATIDELDLDFTPLDTTLTDTVKWLYETGHITSRQAGALAI